MSEENTQNLPDGGSFEERVFARFDSLDSRLGSVETRLESVEIQVERRALETKPIWERALAEIAEVRADVAEVKADVAEVKTDVAEVKTELGEVKERLGALEELTRPMLRKIDLLTKDMMTLRAEQLGLEDRIEKLEPSNVS
jgi:chromosome segregation ATPase